MIDDAFRRVLPAYSRALIAAYTALGLSPNAVSLLGAALGVAAAVAVAAAHPIAALALWWLGRLFDGTDGIYARATERATPFGAYLDICLDMFAYSVMVLGFAALHPELMTRWLVILLLYVLCIASALALGSQEEKLALAARDDRGLRLGAGLAEGGETGIAYTLFLLLPAWIDALSALWIGVLATTVVARTALARRVLARGSETS